MGTDEPSLNSPESIEAISILSELEENRGVYQARARAWIRTPAFQEVYEDLHPGWFLKLVAVAFGAGKTRMMRSGRLWRGYQRLAEGGELLFAGMVMGNHSMSEMPNSKLPAAVVASSDQTVQGLLHAGVFADQLCDFYMAGGSHSHPLCAKLMADDDYYPLRCRPMPIHETDGYEMSLFDIRISAMDTVGEPDSLPFVPMLVHPQGGPFAVIPWHVIHGRPTPQHQASHPASPPPLPQRPPPLPTQSPDVSTEGSMILRHSIPQREFEFAVGNSEDDEAINQHVEHHIGEAKIVFHEIVSDLVHVDVLFVDPTPERPFYTLVTSGMSDCPMNVPEGADEYRYAELMLRLPPDWKLGQQQAGQVDCDDFKDERNYWPVRWLRKLARFPHEYQTWLGPGHTIPNCNPPEPVAEGSPFSGFILSYAAMVPDGFHQLQITPRKTVNFYALLPLTAAEMEFKLSQGSQALASRMSEHGITELVVSNRQSVV